MTFPFVVRTFPFEDIGDEFEDGLSDFCYTGTIYEFLCESVIYTARQYSDTQGEIAFLCWQKDKKASPKPFENIPYGDIRFTSAVSYLMQEGVTKFSILTQTGYQQVNMGDLI